MKELVWMFIVAGSMCYGLVDGLPYTGESVFSKDHSDGPFEKNSKKVTVHKDGVYKVNYFLKITQKGKTNSRVGIGVTLVDKKFHKEKYYLVNPCQYDVKEKKVDKIFIKASGQMTLNLGKGDVLKIGLAKSSDPSIISDIEGAKLELISSPEGLK